MVKVFSNGYFESSNMVARGHISLVCRQILKCLGHISLWQKFQTFAMKWTIRSFFEVKLPYY